MFQTARMLTLVLQKCRSFFPTSKKNLQTIDPTVVKAKRSTKLSFFITGLSTAPWAVLMPILKQSNNMDESHFAILLLSFGGGALLGMPIAGILSKFFNFKLLIGVITVLIFSSMLVIGSCATDSYTMLLFIILWGSSVGIYDVLNLNHASNIRYHK